MAQKGGKMMLFVSSDLRWIYRSGGIFSSPGVRTVLSTGQLAKTRQGRGLQLSNLARDKSAELSVKGNFQTIMEYSRPWRTNIFFFYFKRPYSFNFVNSIVSGYIYSSFSSSNIFSIKFSFSKICWMLKTLCSLYRKWCQLNPHSLCKWSPFHCIFN